MVMFLLALTAAAFGGAQQTPSARRSLPLKTKRKREKRLKNRCGSLRADVSPAESSSVLPQYPQRSLLLASGT